MKKQNEINKLNNTKKKLLAYATLATLGSSVLIGCQNSSSQNDDKDSTYQTNDDGTINIKNDIGYEKLAETIPVKITTMKNDDFQVYLTLKTYGMRVNNFSCYIDIITNKVIIDSKDTNLEYMELGNTSDYLVSMNMIKDKYSQEDIEKVIEYISECEKENPKVKEKTEK